MTDPAAATTKRMALRYAGVCRCCGVEVPARVVAMYKTVAKNVICLGCADEEPEASAPVGTDVPDLPDTVPADEPAVDEPDVVVGVAGASARREYERRKDNDERRLAEMNDRVPSKHPFLGGLKLAAADDLMTTGTRA